ncbi:MAG: MBOAT family O-acyltransferase [Candidatus Ventricola sp.]
MLFNSFGYLCFLPLVTCVYFLLPRNVRWVWLLVASYYFYMCWNAAYACLIALSTVVTYACALLVEGLSSRGARRAVMLAGLGVNLGILGFFKYGNFFSELAERLLGAAGLAVHTPRFDVLLPVGISFYTFQALGYMLDVCRGRIRAERSLARYALFVSFFPQLVAGPIERSENLLRQVHEPKDWDAERVRDGLCVMLLGFFEKLVVADRAALYADAVFGRWQEASGLQIVLATVAFAFQIYGDFGGYSHIAIGSARILGFDLMDNFRQPYLAVSVRDFWRRWHISLSTWFRDYVYIPLGGSRVGRARRALNTMITFTVSGLWHGASLNYVVWGAMNGALQVIEGLLPARPRRSGGQVLRRLGTFAVICCTWFFFRVHALGTGVRMLRRVLTCFAAAPMDTGFSAGNAAVLAAAIAMLLALDVLHESGRQLTALSRRWPPLLTFALSLAAVLGIVVFGVWGGTYDAQSFIYFVF